MIVGDERGARLPAEAISGGLRGVDGLLGELLARGALAIDFELLLEVEADARTELTWRSIHATANLEVGVVGRADARRGALCARGFEARASAREQRGVLSGLLEQARQLGVCVPGEGGVTQLSLAFCSGDVWQAEGEDAKQHTEHSFTTCNSSSSRNSTM